MSSACGAMSPETADSPGHVRPDLQHALLYPAPLSQVPSAPQASVTALKPHSGQLPAPPPPLFISRFFKYLCMNSFLLIASFLPATSPPTWLSYPQPGSLSFPTRAQKPPKETETQGKKEVSPGRGERGQGWAPVPFLILHSGKKKTSGLTLEPLTHNW